jgi:hypothetical protein
MVELRLMKPPLCIDLFCGLGGWTEGFLAEGYDVVGFDNTRHVYGEARYPGQLVLQDVLTLHGSQFAGAACIVASPPCQAFSWMGMPWSLAKREVAWQRWERNAPIWKGNYHLTDLFEACFRIQREATEAAGHCIPLVIENVRGAQPWVGPAKGRFGSFYLWGDVESVGGRVVVRPEFGAGIAAARLRKVAGFNFHQHENTGQPGGSFQSASVAQGVDAALDERRKAATGLKRPGISLEVDGMNNYPKEGDGLRTLPDGSRVAGRANARAAASAMIAKIPFELARYIASANRPRQQRRA